MGEKSNIKCTCGGDLKKELWPNGWRCICGAFFPTELLESFFSHTPPRPDYFADIPDEVRERAPGFYPLNPELSAAGADFWKQHSKHRETNGLLQHSNEPPDPAADRKLTQEVIAEYRRKHTND